MTFRPLWRVFHLITSSTARALRTSCYQIAASANERRSFKSRMFSLGLSVLGCADSAGEGFALSGGYGFGGVAQSEQCGHNLDNDAAGPLQQALCFGMGCGVEVPVNGGSVVGTSSGFLAATSPYGNDVFPRFAPPSGIMYSGNKVGIPMPQDWILGTGLLPLTHTCGVCPLSHPPIPSVGMNLPNFNFPVQNIIAMDMNTQISPGTYGSNGILAPQPQAQPQLPATSPGFQCTRIGCTKTFTRASDRTRHVKTAHGNSGRRFFCTVPGCVKGSGVGYSQPDKLTEHLWKKHGDLGFVKRR